MVRRRILAMAVVAAITCAAPTTSLLGPKLAAAGIFNDMMRHFGVGYSEGYHARSAQPYCVPTLAAERTQCAPAVTPAVMPPSAPPASPSTARRLRVSSRPVSPAQVELLRRDTVRR